MSIVSFAKLKDGSGYELLMTDGSKITLRNGKDGEKPNIAIKNDNDILYWTINGDYLLDASGNKVIAVGKDGEIGSTPIVRINTDGYWEVSYNKGVKWELVYDVNGNKVKANGSIDLGDFKIIEDDDFIHITYMGQVYSIPKDKKTVEATSITLSPNESQLEIGSSLTFTIETTPKNAKLKELEWESDNEDIAQVKDGTVTAISAGVAIITVKAYKGKVKSSATVKVTKKSNKKLALEYLTEYNVNKTGTGFIDNHIGKNSGYFTWHEAMKLFAANKNFTVDGIGYHLPSFKEWSSIIPKEIMYVETKMPDKLGIVENVTIGDKNATYKSDYRFPGNYVFYAIRFKNEDNEQLSAWRYQFTDNPEQSGEKMLQITVRPLGKDVLSLDDISNPDYWATNNDKDIQRMLPAAGYLIVKDGEPFYYNEYGHYWSSTEDREKTTWAKFVLFSNYLCYSDYQHEKGIYNTTRLFRNNF
ncbi:PL29 family lyase N-terminal domain-containing protein [Porphyromonadaceae bacterium W3.11]|nr:PL29 family lyase N-terminal domain-containing protein [Porphyromonadaceae bacterium W3.11]